MLSGVDELLEQMPARLTSRKSSKDIYLVLRTRIRGLHCQVIDTAPVHFEARVSTAMLILYPIYPSRLPSRETGVSKGSTEAKVCKVSRVPPRRLESLQLHATKEPGYTFPSTQ